MDVVVEQRRGFAVEATHAIDAVCASAAGVVSVLSGVDALTTFRSAAKPFQLAAMLARIPAPVRATLSESELALGSASHHGEPLHLAALARLMSRLSVCEGDLCCGAHAPLDPESASELARAGRRFTALHNNCAGKHAFMAACARAHGEPSDYRAPDHPLQRAIRAEVEARCGAVAGTVVDGCGVPCFVLALSGMARGYAAIARELARGRAGELGAIARALRQHPVLMSGSAAIDGWLIESANVVAKVGAAGLLCLAIPEHELGVAIKVRSGSELARPVAVVALLERHFPGLLSESLPARYRTVTNAMGDVVGELVTRSRAD